MIATFPLVSSPHLVALNIAIESGIRHAMLNAHSRAMAKGSKPQEPDFVAALVVDGIPIFASHLNAIFVSLGGNAKLTGIFCHGKPEVQHGSYGCELGDILFAHFHTDAAGRVHRSALLMQAKLTSASQYFVPPKERHQLELYSDWPLFKYKRSCSSLNGKQRDVFPKNSHVGAQYLLLDDGDPANPSTGLLGSLDSTAALVAEAQPLLDAKLPLSQALMEFMFGVSSGRNFKDQKTAYLGASLGWSAVVWDLIGYSSSHAFNRIKRAGLVNQPRNVTAFFNHSGALFTRSGGQNNSDGVLSEIYGRSFEQWLETGDGGGGINIPTLSGDDEGNGGPAIFLIETSLQSMD